MSATRRIDEIEALRQALADESKGGFFRQRRAARRLARMATGADGREPSLSSAEARLVVEGLVAGLEGIHWSAQRTCQDALEKLKDQGLKEAVCKLLLDRDRPRLRAIAVQARYAPQDPAQRAAYLFVLGSSQFYEAHDPAGELLEQFYVRAPSPIRDRVLGLARSWGENRLWARLTKGILRGQGWVKMSEAEVEASVEVLSDGAYDPDGEMLEQFYNGALLPIRNRILGRGRPWRDPRWVRLVTAILRSRPGMEMSQTEVEAAVEVLSDKAHDPQGELLERFYEGAPLPLRDRLLDLARSWGDLRWVWLTKGFLCSRGWAEMGKLEVDAAVEILTDGAHDPQGELLERFYEGAPLPLRNRLLGQGRPWSDPRWVRLVTAILRSRAWAEMSQPEVEAAVKVLSAEHRWERLEELWTLVLACPLVDSWRWMRALAGGGWRPQESREVMCWKELVAAVQALGDPTSVARSVKYRRAVLEGHQDWVRSLAISPDGATLASGSRDKTIILWDFLSRQKRTVLEGHQEWVESLAISPDGATLASGGSGGDKIILWDLPGGQERAILRGHQGSVESLAISPDGAILASGGSDKTIILWDLPRRRQRAVLQGHQGEIRSLAISPDGATLASASRDKTIILWDIPSGRQRAVLQGHRGWVWSLAISPDGATLASGSEDKTIILWDLPNGRQRAVLQGHRGWIRSLAISPGGVTLASGSEDRTIILWNLPGGEQIDVLQGHDDWVESLAISSGGATLVSGSDDQTIILWELWDIHRVVKVPLGHMVQKDLEWVQHFLADGSLSAEDRVVARYVSAALRYRLGDGSAQCAGL